MFLKQSLITLIFLAGFLKSYGQVLNEYGLSIINTRADYLRGVAGDANEQLVEIKKHIPDIVLDIKYATPDNFTEQTMYTEARAFVRLPVVVALKTIQRELRKQGLGLKVFDAYRPYSVTVKFYDIAKDKNFVAHPKAGSRHNRGCAIDLTLIHLKTGRELKMPTPYDSFAPEASPDFRDLPKKVKANRDLLIGVMKKNGFQVLHNEWWHFDFKDWKEFDLIDIPFNEL